MKRIRFTFKTLAIILIFTVVLTPLIAVTAMGAESSIDYSQYDLSKPGSLHNKELDVADFIEMISGDGVSDLERNYLSGYSYINVKYDEPTSQHVTLTAKDDKVTVTAVPYTYTTSGVKNATWYPVSATVNGTDKVTILEKSGDKYVGVISGVDIDDTTALQVQYKLSFEFVIGKDDINGALNSAFNTAVRMKAEYIATEEEYENALAEYEAYVESQKNFDENLERYEQYLEDYAYYLEDLEYYNMYLEDLRYYEEQLLKHEEYKAKQEAYNQYVEYVNSYPTHLNKYNADLAKYNEYLNKIATVKAQIEMLDTGLYDTVTVKADTLGEDLTRDLYSCMFSGVVDEVVENKDLFVTTFGVSQEIIDGAGASTGRIRTLLLQYNELKTEADKYTFYIANYEALRKDFILLTQCLEALYENNGIKTGMHTKEKTEKYVIFVAQLTLFSNALSDTAVYNYAGTKKLDKSTTITYLTGTQQPYGKVTKNMVAALDGNEYVKDLGNAKPLDGGYPQEVTEPTKPIHPSEMTAPENPAYVQRPTEPEPVEQPIEPEKVEDPRNVTPVAQPVKSPILDSEEYKNAITALESGAISERAELKDDYVYVPEVSVEKTVISQDNVTVTFYGTDGAPLTRIITTKYSSVEYDGKTPEKDATYESAFYFDGWVDSDGKAVDLDFVSENLELYPSFRAVDFIYVDFYDTDRKTVICSLKFEEGTPAVFTGVLPTKTDDYAKYTFSHWVDKNGNKYDLTKPTASAKLYPEFSAIPYVYLNFYAYDRETLLYKEKILLGESASYSGATPTKPSEPEADYTFSGWVDKNGNPYDLSTPKASADLYPAFSATRYVVINFYDTDGMTLLQTARVRPGTAVTFGGKLPTKPSIPEADYVFSAWTDKDGKAFNLNSPTVSADLYPAFNTIRYVVISFFDTDTTTELQSIRVRPGTAVSFSGKTPVKASEPEADYIFSRWTLADGGEYDLSSPDASAKLYPAFTSVKYVLISFYNTDGSLISTLRVRPGTAVNYEGKTPTKDAEPEADYVFSGWTLADGSSYDLSSPDTSAELHPSFTAIPYVVLKFYDTDRTTLLSETRVRPGTLVTYNGKTPLKASEPEADYVFAGWEDENGNRYDITSPNSSAKLYPVFNSIPYVVINFYDTDGKTVIYTARVRPGTLVSFGGKLPEKASEPEADYIFSGWRLADGSKYDLTSTAKSADLYPKFSTVRYVVINFYDTDGSTLIETVRVQPGTAIVFEKDAPEKASEPEADYVFSGWQDAAGNSYDISAPAVSADLYPKFTEIRYVVIKFYDTDRETVLKSTRVLPGTPVSFVGKTPVKASEPEADYVFSGWALNDGSSYDLLATASSAELYPVFNMIRYVVVNFYSTDRTSLIATNRVKLGSSVVFDGEYPVKESVPEADYLFSGWATADGTEFSLDSVNYSTDLYPIFDTVRFIVLNFYDTDRTTLIESLRVRPGTSIVYGGRIPTKDPEPEAGYVFSGWVDADGNAFDLDSPDTSENLYPTFSVTSYIILTFYGTDGTVIGQRRILKGVAYTFDGEQPTKAPETVGDYVIAYVFAGWVDADGNSYDLTRPETSAELYPVFSETTYITLVFHDIDGTVIGERSILKGVSYVFDGKQPTKASVQEADYVFAGWIDENGDRYDLSSPQSTADLYPMFDTIPYVTLNFYDTDGKTLLESVRVRKGTTATFSAEKPIKDSEPEADYVFAGWQTADGAVYDLSAASVSADLYPHFNVIRYVVISFYDTDRTTLLESVRVLPGTAIAFTKETPEKESVPEADYVFAGWITANGEKYDLADPQTTVSLYPEFNTVPYVVVNFYDADRVTLIKTVRVRPGTGIIYNGKTPVKASEPEADYVFAAWQNADGEKYDLTAPMASADLYPDFTAIRFVVLNFYDTDGTTLLKTVRVRPGTVVVFDKATPAKDSEPEADYVFSGWQTKDGEDYDISSPDITADLYPDFTAIRFVVLNFYGTDGETLLKTVRVQPGTSVIFDGETPVKASEPEADYVFSGWQNVSGEKYDITNPGATADLYPAFTSIRYVVIEFYDTDGTTLLQTERVRPGAAVTFTEKTPVKASDPEADYVFVGWQDESGKHYDISNPDTSAQIYPLFNTVRYVIINFYDTDGVTLLDTARVQPGIPVRFNGNTPVKASEPEADYVFAGWAREDGTKYDLGSTSDSADLYPLFNTVRYVVINFFAGDGVTSLYSVRVRPDTAVEYVGEIPAKPTDYNGKYTFTHWVDENGEKYDLGSVDVSADLTPYFAITPYVTVTFFDHDGITVLDSQRVLLGEAVSYNGEIPEKQAEPEAEYTFKTWVDENGTEYDFTSAHGSVSLYPTFNVTKYAIINFYDADGETLLEMARVRVGSGVSFGGEEPVKPSDSDAVYTFSHWQDISGSSYDLTSFNASVDLYPAFSATYYINIAFYAADGFTLLYTDKILPGESASYAGEIPAKDSEPEADYAFTGLWIDGNGVVVDLSSPTSSIDIYPQFRAIRYIVVNFYSYDRVTLLESFRVRPGESTIYSGETPEKPGDENAEYTFTHWAFENGEVYDFDRLGYSADIYPMFKATPYVTVYFYAADRVTILDTCKVLEGLGASFAGSIPEKEGNADEEYRFAHWVYGDGTACDLSAVYASTDVYPAFTAIPYVTIIFKGLDGKELDSVRVLSGESIIFTGETPRVESDLIADYVFDGWVDESGALYDLSVVSESTVLTPCFRTVYKEYELDTDYNGTGITQFTVDLGAVSLTDIPLEHFISVATEHRGALMISTESTSLRFSYASVSAMRKAGAVYASAVVTLTEQGYDLEVIIKDLEGKEIELSVSVTVSFACEDDQFVNSSSIVYTTSDGKQASVSKKYDGHTVSFNGKTGVEYEMFVQYDIDVMPDLPLIPEVSLDRAEPGTEIKVNVPGADLPGKIVEVYYFDADGVKHVIENGSFIMPDSYITIGVTVTDIIYTVTFVSDGKILAQNQYKYGDTVVIPRDPTKQNDDTYSYTFIGWSEKIGEVTCDITYHAEFEATLIPEDDDKGIAISEKYLKIIIIAAVAVVIMTMFLGVLILTKRPGGFVPF